MKNNQLSSQLFFAKEAADFLGITVQRLNKLVHDGKINCLKRSNSGTLFHIDELRKRQEETSIFNQNSSKGGVQGVFKIDNKIKQEAVNFSTVIEILACSESKAEPCFDEIGKRIDVSLPLNDEVAISIYSSVLQVQTEKMKEVYKRTYQSFTQLRENDEIIKRGYEDYPKLLASTEQAPRFLYLRGRKALLSEKRTVALVGSRAASEDAQIKTMKIAKMLGENGITVISGLAKGIDVSAHKSALANGFNTIAVIGTNLNQYYPLENKTIQEEIEKKGLVVSQFSPASRTQKWFFPLRNGVMSGLSLATVIIEAGETSGALKQADFALKQGRLIMIPESALNNLSITWPKRYVERGAVVVKASTDIIVELAKSNIFQIDSNKIQLQQSFEDLANKSNEPPKRGQIDIIIE